MTDEDKDQKQKYQKEVHHKTSLPTIEFEEVNQDDMAKGRRKYIKVSDESSEKALKTFEKIRDKYEK